MPSKKPPRRDPEAALRASRALAAYLRTGSYEESAKEAGYASRGAARTAIQRELDRTVSADVEELRQLFFTRYQTVIAAIWQSCLGNPNAPEPDYDVDDFDTIKEKMKARRPNLFAIDRFNELTREARKMMGVDVQQAVLVTPPNIIISEEVAAAIDGRAIAQATEQALLPEGGA